LFKWFFFCHFLNNYLIFLKQYLSSVSISQSIQNTLALHHQQLFTKLHVLHQSINSLFLILFKISLLFQILIKLSLLIFQTSSSEKKGQGNTSHNSVIAEVVNHAGHQIFNISGLFLSLLNIFSHILIKNIDSQITFILFLYFSL
jgi:hypothetical protein